MDTAQFPQRCIIAGSPRYPCLLIPLEDRPRVLYLRGSDIGKDERCITIVGTRNMTPYGKTVVHLFVRELARYGFTIVSGMAMGVDGEAHRAALQYGAKTIGILASGVDTITPPQHEPLARDILAHGGSLVSEYAAGTPAQKFRFRARNRILAGVSKGVLVVEAGERSGTQITARCAGEYGRPVFAVPGPLTSQYSEGTKMLVNNGAKLVTSVKDILEEFNDPLIRLVQPLPKGGEVQSHSTKERRVLQCIRAHGTTSFHQLLDKTAVPMQELQQSLVLLELSGCIKQEGDQISILI